MKIRDNALRWAVSILIVIIGLLIFSGIIYQLIITPGRTIFYLVAASGLYLVALVVYILIRIIEQKLNP